MPETRIPSLDIYHIELPLGFTSQPCVGITVCTYISTQTGSSLHPTHHSCAGVVKHSDEAYSAAQFELAKIDIDPAHLGQSR